MYRLVAELLRLSDPQRTQYLPAELGWVDGRGDATLDFGTLGYLREAVGSRGLEAADRLVALRLQHLLAAVIRFCRAGLDPGGP